MFSYVFVFFCFSSIFFFFFNVKFNSLWNNVYSVLKVQIIIANCLDSVTGNSMLIDVLNMVGRERDAEEN